LAFSFNYSNLGSKDLLWKHTQELPWFTSKGVPSSVVNLSALEELPLAHLIGV
jgi:hypothetical protein